MSLESIYELRGQPIIHHAATAACMVAAEAIRNEAGNAANHAARLAWSLQSPDFNTIAILPMIAMNAQVQSDWAAHPGEWSGIDDGAIQFIVNSWVSAFVLD